MMHRLMAFAPLFLAAVAASADPGADRGQPRTYAGKNLEAFAMPVGGIGSGSIWLYGDGRLGTWQIFNNLTETTVPDSFFAVRAKPQGGAVTVKALQLVSPGDGFPAAASITARGEYPFARLDVAAPDLPVAVQVEAYNPLIPLDTKDSAIPCAIYRLTAKNDGSGPIDVSFLGSLQNAVGFNPDPSMAPKGVASSGYGRNRNTAVREGARASVHLERVPPYAGPLAVARSGGKAPEPVPFQCVDAPGPAWDARTIEAFEAALDRGATVVVTDTGAGFFGQLASLRGQAPLELGNWQLIGPFDNTGSKGFAAEYPPEKEIDLAKEYEGKGGRKLKWREKAFHDGQVNNLRLFDDNDWGVVYLHRVITAGAAQTVKASFGSDDTLTVWLNGERLIHENVYRGCSPDQNAAALQLKPGENHLLIKVCQGGGGWAYFFRLEPLERVARGFTLAFESVGTAAIHGDPVPVVPAAGLTALAARAGATPWQVASFTQLKGLGLKGGRALAALPDGTPLLVETPYGKGRIVFALAPGLPWPWIEGLVADVGGIAVGPGDRVVSAASSMGSMALSVIGDDATPRLAWKDAAELAADFADDGRLVAGESIVTPPGETVNAALAAPFTLAPGASKTVTFAITWHFPNRENVWANEDPKWAARTAHRGNMYNRWFADAGDVARHVAANLDRLDRETRLYHDSVYASNLPYAYIDAVTSQSVIFRGPTVFWTADGYFGGFEGSYGCCALNCTHVWNYAQSHARLFPEIGRTMRRSDLITFMEPTGEVVHRQHRPHPAFIDGQAATIEAALREHQMSPDRKFLDEVYSSVKKATEWLIKRIDADEDGVPAGSQWNTYDTYVTGANTYIGSQYLCALAAAAAMARVEGDAAAAERWQRIREAGSHNQDERLWKREYYVQIIEPPPPGEPQPPSNYGVGCHADQLLGQWWAHQLNLGYLYPENSVRTALRSILKYNFRTGFAGFRQNPRRYVEDDDGGLLICTWPHGGRPNPSILYCDEVWTGIEYAYAGALMWEGMADDAVKVVQTARARYDGRVRTGPADQRIDNGPGGNPFNDLECGKFYARAMSSWGLLLAAQGFIHDGPAGVLGFKPRWHPEGHQSFFTAAEGWGVFKQRRADRAQAEVIECRWGRLRVKELVFEVPAEAAAVSRILVRAAGAAVHGAAEKRGNEVRFVLDAEVEVPAGQKIEAAVGW